MIGKAHTDDNLQIFVSLNLEINWNGTGENEGSHEAT